MPSRSRSRSRSRHDSRYDSPYIDEENKSFLDHVTSFGDSLGELGETIAHTLGFSYGDEETDASTLSIISDSRNDVSDEVSLRYESKRSNKSKKNENRVDPEGDYLQQNLRNIYKSQQTKHKNTKKVVENDDLSLDLGSTTSDDMSLSTSNSIELNNYYSQSECSTFEEKPLTSCLRPASALKKPTKKSKKKSFLKKSVEEPVGEKKQVKWMDQIAADFDPYLFEMRRVYAKEMANVRLAMNEHNVVMEKIMNENTMVLCNCGEMSGELSEC
uniref:Uncharacterized protein n=1 Tax=Skeletonema marinoi TaxID=267567 RepID=A0A7S1CRR9_9STRA|mmetsp:Transcript_1449/g.2127  ORF Transcript_1449/g.2127 Transcript_1449/m.2127 type:complete len:272 (+) Transcript_1449:78-893(+)